ncbi:MAG: 2-hydroxyhepta-2,4-diene,7-dioate isomerase [Homoserinimonas sp.]|jgi:acylpyruvate hydrolase|nr:2-hydroxyhepta-2,4-diene,7-dioate isomerase [Homoserinimonas sp.]
MAYASFSHQGVRAVGEVDGDQLHPLQGVNEIGHATTRDVLDSAQRLQAIALADVILLPVVPNPGRIFCIGLNYKAHIEETKREDSDYPVMFPKFASSLIGANDDIILPPESTQLDYEGELAVIIGKEGRRVAEEDADEYLLGYCVSNDVTMRDYQYKTHQWMQGKAWDKSTPLGPYLVMPDEVDITRSGIRTILNGVTVQESGLSMLIFSIPRLIATISEFTTIQPGDVILTGTPGGVGFRREPQLFMRDGDVVRVEIDGVGALTNTVRAESV